MSDKSCKLYTAEQVRGIDSAAIDGMGIPGYELMCRAGRAVLDDARQYFPSAEHWLIMCGPGNNGGDGYVVARLAVEAGLKVTVCSLVEPGQLKGDAAIAYTDWKSSGGEVLSWPLADDLSFDLAFDALLGTGIDREVGGRYRESISYLNQLQCPKYAIDIPSGLNADTGVVMGCAVNCRNTMTFVGRKRGMYTADGQDHCGHISFDNLAIPAQAADGLQGSTGVLLTTDILPELIKPRSRNSHKGSYGHVLAVGGAEGMSGAIRLCGEAALRSGAGRVTLATAPAHAAMINLSRPELMVNSISGASELLPLLDGDHIVAAGPGFGNTQWAVSLLDACLATQLPLVIDADGLNLLAERSRDKVVSRGNWILTPHPAEAARLLGCTVSEVQQDRVGCAHKIAENYDACVVLKGCGTVVASPAGDYAICPLGNPGMATAGSGDVLTGIIAALWGQGLSGYEAAMTGVLAHAMAGDYAARVNGEMALMAGDITDHLPLVWKATGV